MGRRVGVWTREWGMRMGQPAHHINVYGRNFALQGTRGKVRAACPDRKVRAWMEWGGHTNSDVWGGAKATTQIVGMKIKHNSKYVDRN